MTRQIALLLICSAAAGQTPLDESDKKGVVEILVVDSRGVPVHEGVMISVRQVTKGEQTPEIRVGRKPTLKYGTYELMVRASPAYPVDKIIKVRERYQVVFVPLFLAPIELPRAGNLVRGRLPAASRERGCTWARLISPVSENEYANARAFRGEVVFENIKPGAYILVTFGDEGICGVAQVNVINDRLEEMEVH